MWAAELPLWTAEERERFFAAIAGICLLFLL